MELHIITYYRVTTVNFHHPGEGADHRKNARDFMNWQREEMCLRLWKFIPTTNKLQHALLELDTSGAHM